MTGRALAGADRLDDLARLADEARAEALAQEARALAERVRAGRFFVACVGQFKRGKSSLLNALVGEPLLPVGVAPVTAVVTVLRHGPRTCARVRCADGAWREIVPAELADYVTEDRNPGNGKGVAAVEAFVPSPLLAGGMCLVDTPGIGSVFAENTAATRAFVPHIDAALVVLGADPPISAEELELVERIAPRCPDLVFALNKADKLGDDERAEAVRFTQRVLAERLGRPAPPLFEVSATERSAGRGPERGWPALTEALATLAHDAGGALVRAAEQRGAALVADRLRLRLDEQRGALLRPVEESTRRVEALHTQVAYAERLLNDVGHLFTAEQERLGRIFAERTAAFLEHARPGARREFAAALHAAAERRGGALRRKAFALADETAHRWLDTWRAEAQPAGEELYVQATQRFVDAANEFLDRLAATGDPALAALPRVVRPETGFRVRSRMFFTSLLALTGRSPGGWLLDLVRPHAARLRVLEREVGEYLDTLVFANANRIAADFDDRMRESRRRFLGELRASLVEVTAAAERALARANECRAAGADAVRAEVERLGTLDERLAALRG